MQDEVAVAAYKTVELDTLLGDTPVQHREVEGHESERFLSYFKQSGGIVYHEGGVKSGLNVSSSLYFQCYLFHCVQHVDLDDSALEREPRLMHVKGRRVPRIREVPVAVDSLNQGDVFVLDMRPTLYLWAGESANR